MSTATIRKVWAADHYLLDPHGAVGFLALERYLNQHTGSKGMILETAHPVKFPSAVEAATGMDVPLPAALKDLMQQTKMSQLIKPEYNQLREYLLSR